MVGEVRDDITKEEAAQRQIDTAIHLTFLGADAISIHVLAMSASVIVQNVCSALGKKSFRTIMLDRVKPEFKVDFARKMKEAYNFFKHADRDHSEVLGHFDEAYSDLILLECCMDFSAAFGRLSFVMGLFAGWTMAVKPNLFLDEMPFKAEALDIFSGIDKEPRSNQLRIALDNLVGLARAKHLALPIPI